MGTIYLFVPKLRKGGYIPFFVNEKKRSEVALMNVIQEAYINGVSTRKIERLAKSLGIDSISRGQVSEITKELNDQVAAFRSRPLNKTYPVIWVDALYEKIRYGRQVRNMAVLVVIGVGEDGKRDILAIEPMHEESEATYRDLFQSLKDRGLQDAWLVVSDAHKGLVKAIQASFIGCSWQRCKVHFSATFWPIYLQRERQSLNKSGLQPDIESAKAYANHLMDEYEGSYPGAVEVLEAGLEDSLQFYNFKRMDSRKISSTNMLERLNREIRRRTSVVGIFPSIDSYIRLVTTHLIEYGEDWSTGRCYIKPRLSS